MNDELAPIHVSAESLEGRRSVELVRDEDVLSPDLQGALEQVGTGVAVVAVVALLFSQLPRARRFLDASTPAADKGQSR